MTSWSVPYFLTLKDKLILLYWIRTRQHLKIAFPCTNCYRAQVFCAIFLKLHFTKNELTCIHTNSLKQFKFITLQIFLRMPFWRSVIQEVNAFPCCKQQTQIMSHVSYNVSSVKRAVLQTVKSWMIKACVLPTLNNDPSAATVKRMWTESFLDTFLMNGNLTVYSVMALERANCSWEKLKFNVCVEII